MTDNLRKVSKKEEGLIGKKVHSTYLKGILLQWLRVSSKNTKTRVN